MLRLENGFPEELYSTDNSSLNNYTQIHRKTVSALMTYDISSHHSTEPLDRRLQDVIEGNRRSATLAHFFDGQPSSSEEATWLGVRALITVLGSSEQNGEWRIKKQEARHHAYPEFGVWSATRTLAKVIKGQDVAEDAGIRVRERYTVSTLKHTPDSEIRDLFEEGSLPSSDTLLATATVYALNKAVKHHHASWDPVDLSLYPAIAAAKAINRLGHVLRPGSRQ